MAMEKSIIITISLTAKGIPCAFKLYAGGHSGTTATSPACMVGGSPIVAADATIHPLLLFPSNP